MGSARRPRRSPSSRGVRRAWIVRWIAGLGPGSTKAQHDPLIVPGGPAGSCRHGYRYLLRIWLVSKQTMCRLPTVRDLDPYAKVFVRLHAEMDSDSPRWS